MVLNAPVDTFIILQFFSILHLAANSILGPCAPHAFTTPIIGLIGSPLLCECLEALQNGAVSGATTKIALKIEIHCILEPEDSFL